MYLPIKNHCQENFGLYTIGDHKCYIVWYKITQHAVKSINKI